MCVMTTTTANTNVPGDAQQSEYNVPVKGRMTNLEAFPGIYNEANAKSVIETDDYKIFDVHYENELGHTLWTTVYITLKPWKQSYYFAFGVNMQYHVTGGNILFIIGTTGHVLRGEFKEMMCVPSGKNHLLWNQRQDKESYCTLQVPARLDLREYLGVAFPDSAI
jgi:hypothetical protein